MKKNTIKAFTLVEMLLIASLMPRMQSAQWRARDVARKNDLAQIQTAIITSQQDRGGFPGTPANTWHAADDATDVLTADAGIIIDKIADNLQKAGMSSVPTDPNGSNDNFGLWTSKEAANDADNAGKYLYLVATRNWVANWWFVLMAKTEVEWWSNWVVCDEATDKNLANGFIDKDDDLATVKTCKTFTQNDADGTCKSNDENCVYKETGQLRYILLY